ncbi:MAG TPA: GNAT family N-acetyltransferase [Conexibacter sp.]|jgi:ribosomal protein S18 acetylase RimI-like enzyme|nr:GNAT family N-acetyltransferase [Conexibacter sp.]
MSPPITRLDWDSAFFGIAIARVNARRLDGPMLAAALRACRAERIRCAYLLLDADDAQGAELAQAAGFVLRDVRVTLERPLEATDAATPERSHMGIDRARPEQHATLEAVARDAFEHTRFLDDGGFPHERCRDLYASFLRRGLDGGPQRMTLATPDAGGFIVCHADLDDGVGTIELIAVIAGSRGHGLGGALVDAAVAAFADAGLRRASVATQAANVASQRVYQRSGFRTRSVGLWFHRWFG